MYREGNFFAGNYVELDVLLDLGISFFFALFFLPFLLLAFPAFAFVDSLAFGHFACLFSFVLLLLFFLLLLLSHFHDQNHQNNNNNDDDDDDDDDDDINNPPHPSSSSSSSYSSSSRMTTKMKHNGVLPLGGTAGRKNPANSKPPISKTPKPVGAPRSTWETRSICYCKSHLEIRIWP